MDKKTIIGILLAAILLLAIPLSVKLLKSQLQLKSKASGNEIRFVTSDTLKCPSGNGICTTSTPDVSVQLDSPFGSPAPSP